MNAIDIGFLIYAIAGIITAIPCVVMSWGDDDIYFQQDGKQTKSSGKITAATTVFFRAFICWPVIAFFSVGFLTAVISDWIKDKE